MRAARVRPAARDRQRGRRRAVRAQPRPVEARRRGRPCGPGATCSWPTTSRSGSAAPARAAAVPAARYCAGSKRSPSRPFELDADRPVVAVARGRASARRRHARRAASQRHELQHLRRRAGSRNAPTPRSPRSCRVVRVRVAVQPVGEQPLDRVAAVLARRQADRVQHHQRRPPRPAGRGPKFGDGAARAPPTTSRRCQRGAAATRFSAGSPRSPPSAADAQPRHAVAHLAQRQAQAGAGRGAVVAVALERALEDVALDLVQVGRQVGGQRRRRRRRRPAAARRRGRGTASSSAASRCRRAPLSGRPRSSRSIDLAAGQRQRAVQQVLELAHVAGEGVAQQVLQRVAATASAPASRRHRAAMRSSTAAQIAGRSSMRSRSGGTTMLDDVEAVVQVLAEAAGLHLGAQVLVRGADDAHVDRRLGHRADRPHRALLDHAQQLALHRQRQVADLVEEQRAALRGLEEALAVLVGAGEGALAVAEELGLQQVSREWRRSSPRRRARLRAATARGWRAPPVPCRCPTRRAPAPAPCCAPPCSTSARTCCMAFDAPTRRCSAGGGAGCRRRGAARRARPAPARAGAGGVRAQRRGHHGAELPQVDRLGQVVEGAGLERLDRVLGRAVGGDDDGLLAAAGLVQPAQQVQPGAVGQPHVGDAPALIALRSLQQRPGLLHACRRSRRRSPRAAASARTACAGRARRRRPAGCGCGGWGHGQRGQRPARGFGASAARRGAPHD